MYSMYMRPCRRCTDSWILPVKASSADKYRRSLTSLTVTLGLRRRLSNRAESSLSKVGMRVSYGWHSKLFGHSTAVWPIAERDLHLDRDISLEQSVSFSRQGCQNQQSRSYSYTTITATAGKHPKQSTLCKSEKHDPRQFENDRGWVLPKGIDTGIKMYNSLTRKKEPFILPKGRIATWYACGPTVYDHAHIGHARYTRNLKLRDIKTDPWTSLSQQRAKWRAAVNSYVRTDIIRRILINHFNIDVVMVMGVTDIDDKIIKRSKETGLTHRHLTHVYEDAFFKDMETMDVMPPTVKTRVTQNIPKIIYFISKLIDQGFGYKTPSGTVYFDVQLYGRYGRLWTHRLDTQIRDSLDKEKRGARDFALWKAAKPDEPSWDSPWGKGRPGWHIECSTMASSIFGENLDIHSGGDDLRFPHHENEMAQSEACLCTTQWTNYWMHTGHLHLKSDTTKMSKSLNNTIRINELLRESTASQFRIFCMLRPYRQHIEFSSESMLKAVRTHDNFLTFMSLAEAYVRGQVYAQAINEPLLFEALLQTKTKVDDALADDFDTHKAIGALEELIRKTNIELGHKPGPEEPFVSRSAGTIASVLAYVERMLSVWGVKPPHKKLPNEGPAKTSLGDMTDSDMCFNNVMDSVVQFRSKVREFALNPNVHLSQQDIKSNEDPNLTPKQRKQLQLQKVRPILNACDELRDDLKLGGVTIKDHGKKAHWVLEDKRFTDKNKDAEACNKKIRSSVQDPT